MLSLQKKCIKACHEKYKPSRRPTLSNELADEENDPYRPRPSGVSPRPPRPSGASPRPPFKPFLVSLVCFINNQGSTHGN